MKLGGAVPQMMHPERLNWFQRLFIDENSFNADNTAAHWKQAGLTMPLQDTNTLAQTLVKLRKGGGDDWSLNTGQIKKMESAIEKLVGPEKMKSASNLANKEMYGDKKPETPNIIGDYFNQLQKPIAAFSNPLTNLNPVNNASKFGGGAPYFANPLNFNPAKPWLMETNRKFTYGESWMPGGFKPSEANFNKPLFPSNFSNESKIDFSSAQKSKQEIPTNFVELNKSLTQNQQTIVKSLSELQTPINDTKQGFTNLPEPLGKTKENIGNLGETSQKTNGAVNGLFNSLMRVDNSLDVLSGNIASWKPPTAEMPNYQLSSPNTSGGMQMLMPPPKASGGRVMSKGLVYIHAGEDIVPASVTKQYEQPQIFNKLISLVQTYSSADGAATSLDNLSSKLFSWQPPVPQVQSYSVNVPNGTTSSIVPSHAVGGIVERDGMAMLHAGNVITPAKTTKGLSGFNSLMSFARENDSLRIKRNDNVRQTLSSSASQNFTLNYSPSVTVNGDDKNSKEDFRRLLNEHSDHIERLVTRIYQNGRIRA